MINKEGDTPGAGVSRFRRNLTPFVLSLAVLCIARSIEAGEVHGVVRLESPVPETKIVTIQPKDGDHSTKGCGSLSKVSPKLLVSPDGGVQNAVVWTGGLPEWTPEQIQQRIEITSDMFLLDQKECVFEPHTLAIPAGSEVRIRNSDSVLHNVRIFREGKPAMLMHRWQKADASDIPWRFTEPGRYIVRCGVHPWMYAWVVVVPSRSYAVTDSAGRFILREIPPGRHPVHVWHETLGTQSVRVQINSAPVVNTEIRFGPLQEGE